jgi:UDP-N-acetylglucosamine 2-epimerase (non-hydrolysing)
MGDARVVLTDSGGMQEETTILGLPCMTLRKNTERPVTIEQGTNRLVDPDEHSIAQAWQDLRRGAWRAATGAPELWDGKAAQRIVRCLLDPGRPAKDP